MRPAAQVRQLGATPVSRLMYMLWASRTDLRFAFDLESAKGQLGLVRWYRANCVRNALPRGGAQGSTLRIGLRAAVRHARQVVAALPAYAKRFMPHGLRGFRAPAGVLMRGMIARLSARTAMGATETPEQAAVAHCRAQGVAGFNLVGHALSELGLGQNLRYACAAVRYASLPYGVVEFSDGVPAQRNESLTTVALRRDNPYAINVLTMSPAQLPDAYCRFGQDFFSRPVNVLYAFWELSRWPDEWREWLDLFDEIWVPTRFVEDAVMQVAKSPVYRVAPCVELPAASGKGRAAFGLPDGRFIFLVVLDAYSYLERKNPLAAVRAFKRAFPQGRSDVAMVIKTMNVDPLGGYWRNLLAECAADPRILFLDRVLSFEDMVSLYAVTDCLVSLHRSEGFGLCIAEAMMCGKPVIATAYSGNLDFMAATNSCLVDAREVAVQPGQYPFGSDQVWADPDIDVAAAYMRELRDRDGWAAELGARAGAWAAVHLGARASSSAYLAALQRHTRA